MCCSTRGQQIQSQTVQITILKVTLYLHQLVHYIAVNYGYLYLGGHRGHVENT